MGVISSHVVYSADRKRQGAPTSVIFELNKVMKNMQAPICYLNLKGNIKKRIIDLKKVS